MVPHRVAGLCLILLLALHPVCWAATAATPSQEPSTEEHAPASPAASREPTHATAPDTTAEGAHGPDRGTDSHGGHENLGKHLPLWSCIPFAGMLLSIALFPLLAPNFWHHHFGKVSAFWAAGMAVPFVVAYHGTAVYEILHIILADYVPFIILLWSLYTVSGGILLRGTLRGTPVVNTTMLIIGTLLASWMGTTGAAMLLIRPFLRANSSRKSRTFMVVFFIFLVANIGGSLTPLGDPPLFLGFLHGVTFFWTFKVLPHMLLAAGILLVVYFITDSYFYRTDMKGK
jgi:Na+/H+ antiporter NhaD/arsenite permease-like protein